MLTFQILHHLLETSYFLWFAVRVESDRGQKQYNLCFCHVSLTPQTTVFTWNSQSSRSSLSPPQPSLSGPGSSQWRLPPTPTSTAAEEASTRTARRCPSGEEALESQKRSKCSLSFQGGNGTTNHLRDAATKEGTWKCSGEGKEPRYFIYMHFLVSVWCIDELSSLKFLDVWTFTECISTVIHPVLGNFHRIC